MSITPSYRVLQYAQEQEFYRQTALISKKDKEKVQFCFLLRFSFFGCNVAFHICVLCV
jgi:hypothetical protein